MDLTPLISPVVTVVLAVVGAYVATKDSHNKQFEDLKVQNAEQTALIHGLKEQVEKHNGVIERTFTLETEMRTAFRRIDELRDADEKLDEKIERHHG